MFIYEHFFLIMKIVTFITMAKLCLIVLFHLMSYINCANTNVAIALWAITFASLMTIDLFSRVSMHSAILIYPFCSSICLSVQCQYCVKTNGHVVTLDDQVGASLLFFSSSTAVTKFRGNPFSRGVLKHGGGEIWQISPFILEMVRDRAIVTMEHK